VRDLAPARQSSDDAARWWSDAAWVTAAGMAVRVAVVAWAAGRIPPTADGEYYHVLASRIAAGQGYTWAWPDGVVTYAAHYPVGYPAVVAALYAVFGASPVVAMLFNSVIGALAVFAVHQIAASVANRWGALLAGVAVALHPALVAYTPALMTEGVVAALLAVAGWGMVVARSLQGRRHWMVLVGLGVLLGVSTLIRPQVVVAAPIFGLLAAGHDARCWRKAILRSIVVGSLAVATCLPWSLRNCFLMNSVRPGVFAAQSCVFVSANGGWNLLIGAGPGATGTWEPIERVGIPAECREVYGEADKDRCFGRAGVRQIREHPWRWLGLVPKKLAATFDTCGAAGWYLHAANSAQLPNATKTRLDTVELVFQRLLLVVALVGLWRGRPPRNGRMGIGDVVFAATLLLGLAFAVGPRGWVAYLALVVGAVLLRGELTRHPPAALAAVAVGTTALTHAVFFGAGRYSLVCFALMAALAGSVLVRSREFRQ
jgi:4-amino-4-deoxy-L-arabinose transferase-like glycosyltransferase